MQPVVEQDDVNLEAVKDDVDGDGKEKNRSLKGPCTFDDFEEKVFTVNSRKI